MDANTVAFLEYTSRSTSGPKGVIVSRGNLLHTKTVSAASSGRASGRSLWAGCRSTTKLGNVLQPLFVGARCVLIGSGVVLQRPRRWLEDISRYRATTSGSPNFAYDLCVHRIPAEREGAT